MVMPYDAERIFVISAVGILFSIARWQSAEHVFAISASFSQLIVTERT